MKGISEWQTSGWLLTFLHNGFVDCGLAFGQGIPLVTGECAVSLEGIRQLVTLAGTSDPLH